MIALDYTVAVQVVAFLVLWFLLSKLLFGPFLGLVEERERKTEGAKAQAVALAAEADRLRAEYERGVESARDEGYRVREGLIQEGRRVHEELLGRTREEASSLLQSVREEIQSAMKTEREVAAREAEAIARQMVEKILGRGVG